MTDHERARELYWKIFQRKFYPSDPQDETDAAIECITEAFQAQRREVWREAAKKFDKKFFATDHRLDSTRDYRVDEFYEWLRAKAKEMEP